MPSSRLLATLFTMTLATAVPAQEPDWAAVSKETLGHLQTMIRLNTVNPPGNEMQVAKFLETTMKAAGIETHLFEPAPGRAAFVARLKGNGSKQPVLMRIIACRFASVSRDDVVQSGSCAMAGVAASVMSSSEASE